MSAIERVNLAGFQGEKRGEEKEVLLFWSASLHIEPSADLSAVRKAVALQMHAMSVLWQFVVCIPAIVAACCRI